MLSPHQVYKGSKYYSLDLPNIANVLSRIERFNSQTHEPITVAQHLIHCYDIAEFLQYSPREIQLVLYHDVPESYYGDIPTYIKRRLGDEAHLFLHELDQEIYQQLGIEWPVLHEEEKVKVVDLTALYWEASYGFGEDFVHEDWPEPVTDNLFFSVSLMDQKEAELTLLQLLKEFQRIDS